jgi:hypothetical protein
MLKWTAQWQGIGIAHQLRIQPHLWSWMLVGLPIDDQ